MAQNPYPSLGDTPIYLHEFGASVDVTPQADQAAQREAQRVGADHLLRFSQILRHWPEPRTILAINLRDQATGGGRLGGGGRWVG